MQIHVPNCIFTKTNLSQFFGSAPLEIIRLGGKGSGFDSDGCNVSPMSSVSLAIRAVVDMVRQADFPVVLLPRLVNVVLSEDFPKMIW